MPAIVSLVKKLTPGGSCDREFSEVKEFVKQLMRFQIPQGIQVVATDESYYTDHGLGHIERVVRRLEDLCGFLKEPVNEKEAFLLLVATYCHDLGMFLGGKSGETYEETRGVHHIRSAEVTQDLNDRGFFHLEQHELDIAKSIISAHRVIDLRSLPKIQRLRSEIRTRLLGAFLRIADASDCDHSRAPRATFDILYGRIPAESREHWETLFPVVDVYFDPRRSSIVISIERKGSLEEIIEKHRSGSMVERELSEELTSVSEVFLDNNIPLTHVDIQDFNSSEFLDLSRLPIQGEYILMSLKSGFERTEDLATMLEHVSLSNTTPLIIEIRPPEGPIFIDSGLRLDVSLLSELRECTIDSLGDDSGNIEVNQT